MNRQRISFVLGERLKALREKRDLSHDKLIKQLNEKYGITVSRDSLMAYEIADESRAKASKLPNLGMRVEYLYCLADFYGVSLDYLVGKTDVAHADMSVRKISELTGLSEKIVTFFVEYGAWAEQFNAFLKPKFLPQLAINLRMLETNTDHAKQLFEEVHSEAEKCDNNLANIPDFRDDVYERLKDVRYCRFELIELLTEMVDATYGYKAVEQTADSIDDMIESIDPLPYPFNLEE